jgi:subtilisin-like proprotein convertase family protein
MKRNAIVLAAALGLLGAMGTAATAAPDSLVYSGRLTATNGLPYDGDVDLLVTAWDAATDGNLLWTQPTMTITVDRGLMSVELDASGLSEMLAGNDDVWFEFEVDGATVGERQKASSTAFAMRAGNAGTLAGHAASDFVAANAAVSNAALPTNGISKVSNAALSNEFEAIAYTWTGGIDIPDYPGPGAQTSIAASEAAGSYMTSLTVYTQFSLTLNSEITMVLVPPAGSGVGAITLIDGSMEMPADTYATAWTIGNAPDLADLIGKPVSGTWTLTITDITDDGGPGTMVGELEEFEIVYDVVRSDQLHLAGQLEVSGDLNVAGRTVIQGDLYQPIHVHHGKANESGNEKYFTTRAFTFTKQRPDTKLLITWNDNFRTNGGSGHCYWYYRFTGPGGITKAACTAPYDLRADKYDAGANHHTEGTQVRICSQIAGAPIAAGDWTLEFLESGGSADCYLGWPDGQFYFFVEEVY